MKTLPYPSRWVRREVLDDGSSLVLRPSRPDDETALIAAFDKLSDQTRYQRFMRAMHELPPAMARQLLDVDYKRSMALVAETAPSNADEQPELVGVARYAGKGKECEFAIVVADAWQGRGLGKRMMRLLMRYARRSGFKTMVGSTFSTNINMIEFMQRLGFSTHVDPDGATSTLLKRKLPLRI